MPSIKVRASKAVGYTPFDVRWVPLSARMLVVGGNARGRGVIQVFETVDGGASLELVSETERPSSVKCATFGARFGGECVRHVVTGDFQGQLCVLDPERLSAGPLFTAQAHSGVLNSVDGVAGVGTAAVAPPEVATGGQDGCALVWDLRLSTGPVVQVPARRRQQQQHEDCWAVALGNNHGNGDARYLCAAFDSGRVSLYDLRKVADPVFERQTGKGICGVAFDRADGPMNKLLTAGLDARLCAYDLGIATDESFAHVEASAAATLDPATTESPKTTAWFARPLPQNSAVFACGTGTGNLGLWRLEHDGEKRTKKAAAADESEERIPGKLVQIVAENLSSQPIVAADWNTDIAGFAAVAVLDQTIKLVLATKLC